MKSFFMWLFNGHDGRVVEKDAQMSLQDEKKRQQIQEIRTRLQVVREQLDTIERRKAGRIS
jgi:hypothetical protein